MSEHFAQSTSESWYRMTVFYYCFFFPAKKTGKMFVSRWAASAWFSWWKVWKGGDTGDTWKRVNDPKRSDIGSIIVGSTTPYPYIIYQSYSIDTVELQLFKLLFFGGRLLTAYSFYLNIYCLLLLPEHEKLVVLKWVRVWHDLHYQLAQHGRFEHSKCQTVCWIYICFGPFGASSAVFQGNSPYPDHEQHVDPDQS